MAGRSRRRTTSLFLLMVLATFGLLASSAAMAVPPTCEGARCYEGGILVGEWYSCPGFTYHWWGQCEQTSTSNWIYFDACAEHYCDEAFAACVQQPSSAPGTQSGPSTR